MGLTAKLTASIYAKLTSSQDLGNSRYEYEGHPGIDVSNGSADYQATKVFTDTRTIAASGNEDLDLAAGLTDPLGNTLTFATVKAILIKAAAGNTNNVEVSPAASNGFDGPFGDASDVIAIPPGGSLMVTAPKTGWTVTADTGDLLNIANSSSGTGVTYDVVIIGT